MSHLREQISALIDGELTGAELDRANAHLAACGRCRAEAMALRQLKRELRALAAGPFDMPADAADRSDTSGASGASGAFAGPAFQVPWHENVGGAAGPGAGGSTDEALTRRLLAMAGPGGPVPSRRFRREQFRHKSRDQRGGPQAAGRGGASAGRRRRTDGQRYDGRPPRAARRRGRYVIWSAVSVVVVGIGAAAFGMGGSPAQPGPKVTPQLEMFSVEHAITSGDVPFPDPTQAPTARP